MAKGGYYAKLYSHGVPPTDPAFDRPFNRPSHALARHAAPETLNREADLGHALVSIENFYPPSRNPITAGPPIDMRAAMRDVISSLSGSNTHRLALTNFGRHPDGGNGTCAWCGRTTPCPARQHAAAVIEAAGEDPRWYEAPAPRRPRPIYRYDI
jgi:hypothetical protein